MRFCKRKVRNNCAKLASCDEINFYEPIKEKIEKDFGEPLEWERLEGKRACRISKRINIGGYRDPEENWPNIHEAMVDAMIRLEKSMKPHIMKLTI